MEINDTTDYSEAFPKVTRFFLSALFHRKKYGPNPLSPICSRNKYETTHPFPLPLREGGREKGMGVRSSRRSIEGERKEVGFSRMEVRNSRYNLKDFG
jgi:hypothetical protein